MEQKDSDYFFGRARETVEVISCSRGEPRQDPHPSRQLGVGKSSLAQAGVLAALIRQAWPETIEDSYVWPDLFHNSRRWCFLTLRPGTEPVRSLVEVFLETWQLDRTGTEWPERRAEWSDKLIAGQAHVARSGRSDQTATCRAAASRAGTYLIYIDQGEELYVRAEAQQRRRFSELLKQGVADPRLHALMSMRSDFLGEFQKDEPLYSVHQQINVPPMREDELRELVSRPAALLSARFEF